MAGTKDILLAKIRNGQDMSAGEQMKLSVMLSLPAILAQLSSVLMQYIDSAMVGNLGAGQGASIGLVSTCTWLFGGFCMAATSGFSVQVAHLVGANDFKGARAVMRKGFSSVLVFCLVLTAVGVGISGALPGWLGGGNDIRQDATEYFLIYAAFLPAMQLGFTAGAMLQASGNMKVPSILNVLMCVLDVAFNYIFIYVEGMGVRGAALGTGLAELVTAALMLWFLFARSPELSIIHEKGSFVPDRRSLGTAWGITGPMWLQNIISRGAYVASTIIVAPLGTIAVAANSFAITAESFCYMPGYGIQEASTTLIGQSLGAGRKTLARRFAKFNIAMGSGIMLLLGVVMFVFAPQMMRLMCPDPSVVTLGVKVLRIEAFAEALYGASIVAYGCCLGGGDTLVPTALELVSMWVVRIGLALVLTPALGLEGYWIAMCVELNVRGLLFLWRMRGERWMKLKMT